MFFTLLLFFPSTNICLPYFFIYSLDMCKLISLDQRVSIQSSSLLLLVQRSSLVDSCQIQIINMDENLNHLQVDMTVRVINAFSRTEVRMYICRFCFEVEQILFLRVISDLCAKVPFCDYLFCTHSTERDSSSSTTSTQSFISSLHFALSKDKHCLSIFVADE